MKRQKNSGVLAGLPLAACRRASGAEKGKAIAVDSSSESDVDVTEPDNAGNFARCFSSEDALRDEAQYWANTALARRLTEEEMTKAVLDVSFGDAVLETMQSERLSSFRRDCVSSLRDTETSLSDARRRCRRGSVLEAAPPRRGRGSSSSPPTTAGGRLVGTPRLPGGRSGVLMVSHPFC